MINCTTIIKYSLPLTLGIAFIYSSITQSEAIYSFGFPDKLPPFSYTSHGKPAGLDIDIIKAVFLTANLKIYLKPLSFPQLISSIRSQKLDGVTGLYAIEDTQFYKHVIYSKPIYYSSISIYTSRGNKIKSISDFSEFKGKRIAYHIGFLSSVNDKVNQWSKIIAMPTIEQLISRLKNNKLDYIIIEDQLYYSNIDKLFTAEEFTSVYQERIPVSIGISKARIASDNDTFYNRINTAIDELHEDGTIRKMIRKYDLTSSIKATR